MSLHIREKRNNSGSVSIQIIDRKNRGYKVVETIGCAKNDTEKEIYVNIANNRVKELNKRLYPTLFDIIEDEGDDNIEFLNISNKELIPVGDELIYGRLFNDIGCDKIKLKKEDFKRG